MLGENIACLLTGIVVGYWLASDKTQRVFGLVLRGDVNMNQEIHEEKKPSSKKK